MRVLPTALLAFALSGCYTYSPLVETKLAPGDQLRLELTPSGGDSLAHFIGPDVAAVDGRLLQDTPTAYELGVQNVLMHSGIENYWKGESVTIPKTLIAKVETRQLSWGKTGILAGIVLLTAFALESAASMNGSSNQQPPPVPK